MGEIKDNAATYYHISEGKIRCKTTSDDPRAVRRVIEDKDTKEKRELYEIVLKGYVGRIESVEVRKGKFGDQLYIGITDGIDLVYIQMPFMSPYSRTFLERLPNVDTSRDVAIVPYQFENDNGKQVSGTSIYYNYDAPEQTKVNSAYKEYDADGKSVGNIGGYPAGEEGMSSEDWKILGLQQMKFLRENVVSAFPFTKAAADAAVSEQPQKEEKEDDDLPF